MLKTSNDGRKLLLNFDVLAQALEGVAKLRELILTLAVQGKLVPQDASDEPASVLLQRIQAEKARLVAEGKIKKEKPLPEISEEEKPFELPGGWEWVRLRGIARRVQYGVTASADHSMTHPKFVRITDIQNDQVNWETVPGMLGSKEDFSDHYLQSGDLLIARTGGTIGKSFLVSSIPCDAVFASYLIRVSPTANINHSYLKVFASSGHYWRQLYAKSMGTGQPNVNGTALSQLTLPLPPLAEQSRIVARVESLMQLCDALEAKGQLEASQHQQLLQALLGSLTQSADAAELAHNWQRVAAHFDLLLDRPEAIDALEQTILQLAVRGLLVPQDPTDEPASELLKKIRAEKDRLIAEGKIKRDKPLPAIGEEEKPFELPAGWAWIRLGNISQPNTGYAFKSSQYTNDGTLVFRVTNIKSDGSLDLTDTKYINSDQARTVYGNFLLKENDILLVMVGGSLGKIGIIDKSCLPAVLNQNMWKMCCSDLVSKKYFIQVLRYINTNQLKVTNSTHGHLAQGEYLLQPVALPPLAEQSRIVARVGELRALCQQLREQLTQARQTQSLLAQAWVEQAAV